LNLTDSDLQIFDYYEQMLTKHVDFEKETFDDIDKNFNNSTYLKAALVRMLYNLNDGEKASYTENINNEIKRAVLNNKSFDDLYDCCPVYHAYKNMEYLLKKLKTSPINKAVCEPVFLSSFRQVFNQTVNKKNDYMFIVNKFLMKIQKINKNAKKQYEFWKCFNIDR